MPIIDNTTVNLETALRTAIADAATDPLIQLDLGPGGGTITLTGGELSIAEDVTIESINGPVTIDAAGGSRVMSVEGGTNVVLDGLVLTNGVDATDGGGAIRNEGNLTVRNSIIQGNQATGGGTADGGAIKNFGTVTIENSVIQDNSADSNSGAIHNEPGQDLTITDSTIINNVAAAPSGGITARPGSTVNINGSFISGNTLVDGSVNDTGGGGTFNNATTAIGDPLPTIELSVTPTAIEEGDVTTVDIVVTASNDVGVKYVDLAVSGVDAADFTTPIPTQLVIPSGQTTATVSLTVADDGAVEAAETATFTISNPSGAALGAAVSGSVEITDGEVQPTITIAADTPVIEGGLITLTATSDLGPVTGDKIIDVVLDPTSVADASDFAGVTFPAQLTIADGAATGSINLTLADDALLEGAEAAVFGFSPNAASTGFNLGTATATTTINDNDGAQVSIAASVVPGPENAGSAVNVSLTVVDGSGNPVTVPAGEQVTVNVDGAAVSDLDLTSLAVTGGNVPPASITANSFDVVFDGTGNTVSLSAGLADNALPDGDRAVNFSLSNPSANIAIAATSSAAATILDDENPTITITADTTAVSETGSITLTAVTNSVQVNGDKVINIGLDPASSVSNDDFLSFPTQLIIADGQTSGTITFNLNDDALAEGPESAVFSFSADPASTLTLGNTTTTVAVNDNETDGGIDGGTDGDIDGAIDATGILTAFAGGQLLQISSLTTANSLSLDLGQIGSSSVSEIRISTTDSAGGNATQIDNFFLLEGNLFSSTTYSPIFTIDSDEISEGTFLQFEIVENGETRAATVTTSSSGEAVLDFGNSIVLNAELAIENDTTNLLVGDADAIDLTGFGGATVNVNFTVHREAAFNNTVRFYTTDFEDGGILDAVTGNVIRPGDDGYKAAAYGRQLEIELTGTNGEASEFTASIAGGTFLGMYLVVNDTEPLGSTVYFSHLGVNPNGNDHARRLGNNLFGFEDLPGLGDADYDDVVVQVEVA